MAILEVDEALLWMKQPEVWPELRTHQGKSERPENYRLHVDPFLFFGATSRRAAAPHFKDSEHLTSSAQTLTAGPHIDFSRSSFATSISPALSPAAIQVLNSIS